MRRRESGAAPVPANWVYGDALGPPEEATPEGMAEPDAKTLADGLPVGVASSLDGTPA